MSQTFSIQPAKTDEQIKDIADLVMNIFRFSVITHWLDMLEYTQKQENFSLASYIFIQLLEDGILLRKHFNI